MTVWNVYLELADISCAPPTRWPWGLVWRLPRLDADENGLWRQDAGATVFATFDSDTEYFGSRSQQTMLNFRVCDLDAMLAQLRAEGADVPRMLRTWRVSVDSAGSPILRAIGSSCGSPSDKAFTASSENQKQSRSSQG